MYPISAQLQRHTSNSRSPSILIQRPVRSVRIQTGFRRAPPSLLWRQSPLHRPFNVGKTARSGRRHSTWPRRDISCTAAHESLLSRYPLGFADHGADFYLGPGADPERVGSCTTESCKSRNGPCLCAGNQGRRGDRTPPGSVRPSSEGAIAVK
jgi:hypothetical protein